MNKNFLSYLFLIFDINYIILYYFNFILFIIIKFIFKF